MLAWMVGTYLRLIQIWVLVMWLRVHHYECHSTALIDHELCFAASFDGSPPVHLGLAVPWFQFGLGFDRAVVLWAMAALVPPVCP